MYLLLYKCQELGRLVGNVWYLTERGGVVRRKAAVDGGEVLQLA
jgi:hypothetical protein